MAAYETNRNNTTRVCSFVIDSSSELKDLPTSVSNGKNSLSQSTPCRMGSTARTVDSGKTYMLNGDDKWVLYTSASSSGGGGGTTGDITVDVDDYIEPIDDETIKSLFY